MLRSNDIRRYQNIKFEFYRILTNGIVRHADPVALILKFSFCSLAPRPALTLIFQVYISDSQDGIAILVDAWAGTGRPSDDSSFMFPVNFGSRVGLDETDQINGSTDGGDFILLLCSDLWWF